MAIYKYPALFQMEGDHYSVCFPDLEHCISYGSTLEEARKMAEDVLGLCLYDMETENHPIPTPTSFEHLSALHPEKTILMIDADTHAYSCEHQQCKDLKCSCHSDE